MSFSKAWRVEAIVWTFLLVGFIFGHSFGPRKDKVFYLIFVILKGTGSRPRCSVKKVFLEILPNSQESTCARVSFLMKLQASACNFERDSGADVLL